MNRSTPLALFCAAAFMAAPAAAATAFDLRSVDAHRNWVGNADPETAAQGFADIFNNGNVLTGASYTGGLTTPGALYTVSGGSVPLETTPGDLTSQAPDSLVIGRVRFDIANANAAVPININGVAYSDQTYRLRLQDPAQGSFFNSSQTQFMAEAFFGMVTPTSDERYGVRFTDSNGGAFDDVVALDVVRMANGLPGVQIRRGAGDAAGNRTFTGAQTAALSSFLLPGKTLADISLVNLRLFWEPSGTGTNVVRGRVELINVQGGVITGEVGSGTMGATFDIFHGETTTSFQVGASWSPLAAVPEPAQGALLLAGLAVVGARLRRRHPAG